MDEGVRRDMGKSLQSKAPKARKAFYFSSNWLRRAALHLCILIGAMSIVLEKAPHLLRVSPEGAEVVSDQETKSSDQLLAEAISVSQTKPSVLEPMKEPKKAEETPQLASVDTFEELLKQKLSPRATQLLNSFASDKLALWSVFANLSTYSGLVDILNQPIIAFERETLRSQSFAIASGFDQIIYRIHTEFGGTSLVVAQVEGESVVVSLFNAPKEMGQPYQIQRFKDGLWMESTQRLRAQVDEELLKTKDGSSIVLSASVGL